MRVNTVAIHAAFLLLLPRSEGYDRKIKSAVNPGCYLQECLLPSVTLVHVEAEGPNDTLHYLWDFTGKPAILIALAPLNSSLTINWYEFFWGDEKSVTIEPAPEYSFGIVLNKIFEFNDVNDTGKLNVSNKSEMYLKEYDTTYFKWNREYFKEKDQAVVLNVVATGYNMSSLQNGSIRFELKGFGSTDHSETMPHLLHTENSTQVDLVFDKLEVSPKFPNSRFALELYITSENGNNSQMNYRSERNMDDEFSPGVFTLVSLQTPPERNGKGGYLQWKPVCYVSENRDLTNSTETNIYDIMPISNPLQALSNSLMSAYYSYDLASTKVLTRETVISFGAKEDGFYQKTNYTVWTFTVGYGKAPSERFSLLVILIISIALGLPTLLIIVTFLAICIRRITKRRDERLLTR